MYGLNRSMKKPALANGGRVRGPGSGISDDIDTEVPQGSYIMPADSTAQVIDGEPQGFGLKPMPARKQPSFGLHPEMAPKPQPSGPGFGLRRPGEGVPVSLSNGEHSLSPEQVQEVGTRVLDAVRDATHVPAAIQEPQQHERRLFLADGGTVNPNLPKTPRLGLHRPSAGPIRDLYARAHEDAQKNASSFGFGQEFRQTMLKRKGEAEGNAPRLGLHRHMLADGGRVDGYTNSPEREAWLRDIAARGNQSPTAQITAAQPAKPGGLRRPPPREQPQLGIGPNSAGARMVRERQKYADGGMVDDDERRAVPGAPGVQRTGNSYSEAPQAGGAGGALSRAFPNTTTAIRGAGENIGESYRQGGVPAAIGATVRNTMVPALGMADDVMSGARQALDPAANALKTFVTGDATPIGESPAVGGLRRPEPPKQNGLPANPQPLGETGPAVGGLRRPDPAPAGAGFGISSERQPNGVTRFSGTGSPSAASTVSPADRAAAIDAQTDRLRQIGQRSQELRDQIAFNAGGSLTRNKTTDEIARDLITGRSRSGRDAGVRLLQGQQENALQQRQQQQSERMSVPERMRANIAARQAQRVEELQGQLETTTDPAQRRQIIETLRSLNGDPSQNAQVVYTEEPLDPSRPGMGTRRVPMILNRDGSGTPVTPRGPTRSLPNGVSREQAIAAARQAVQNGYDASAVMARLGEYGLTLEDLQQ